MFTSVIMKRLANSALLMLSMVLIFVCKTQGNECIYYYIHQPSSEVTCNPWPYINNYSGHSLVLHSDLLGPQNDDILSVVWYRKVYSGDDSDTQIQRIYMSNGSSGYSGKFNGPNSSGDLTHGFKRINFTLFVNNVTDADAGCYWSEITIAARDCTTSVRNSSVFCLRKISYYKHRKAKPCSVLSVNSSVVCAGNTTCDTLPANWVGDPYLIIVDARKGTTEVPSPSKPLVPNVLQPHLVTSGGPEVKTISEFYNSIRSLNTLQTSQQPLVVTTKSIRGTDSLTYHNTQLQDSTILLPKSTNVVSSSVITSHMPYQGILPTLVSSDSYSAIVSISPSSLPSYKDLDPVTSIIASNEAGETTRNTQTESTAAKLSLSPVQIGIFIGIAVCAVLFAIISMLIFGVVMLCKKTEPKKRPSRPRNLNYQGRRRHTHSNGHSATDSFSGIWRQEPNHFSGPTSIINSGHVISPRSVRTYSDLPATVSKEVEENGKPYISQPIASLPTLLNISSRWKTHSLPLLPDKRASINRGTQLSQSQRHHASLERETRQSFHRHSAGSAALRSRSPDQHYYHVLERPDYCNCTWLEGEDSDESVNAKDTNTSNQRVTIQGDESDNDSLYHWRVVLTSSAREETEGLDQGSSSRKVGRHLYRRLDHSTLEPIQDYAKVSIGRDHNTDREEPHYVA